MTSKINIKSAYKYYDNSMELWNLFLFVEFCSISFCIQRVRKNINNFINSYENIEFKTMSYLDSIYIFENNNLVPKAIFNLKKKFGKNLKKISITKTMIKTLSCFSCYSCNFFINLLECVYVEDPNNIIKNGIYAKYEKQFWKDDDIETLENSLLYQFKRIIYTSDDLINKVCEFVDSKYNYKIFISDKYHEELNYNFYWCDFENCNFQSKKDSSDLFFCKECFLYNNKSYNLCHSHLNNENICQHLHTEHDDINICNFMNWNNEFEIIEESYRIKKVIKDANC